MYHATPNGPAQSQWDVSLDNFKKQLGLLKAYGWETRLISQINETMPSKTVFITFDDGYQNNYAAFEALVDEAFNATWFIVSDTIGKNSVWEEDLSAQRPMLSAYQLQSLRQAGMEVGSHTCSHAKLPTLTTAAIRKELVESNERLETITCAPITSLAYPYGLYNTSARDLTQEVGYRHAVTTKSGVGLVDNDELQIRRIAIYAHDSLATFARKIVFADNSASWLKTIRYINHRLLARVR